MKKIILVLVLLLLSTVYCKEFSAKKIKGNDFFKLKPVIHSTIVKSTDSSDKNKKITFLDLDNESPKVIIGDSEARYPLKIIYKSEETLTVQLVASGTGSVDTFVINLNNGKYVRLTGGNFAGIYGSVSYGACK